MSETTEENNPTSPKTSDPKTPALIPITSQHHLPKLTAATYPIWRAVILAILNGYNLTGYVTGAKPNPATSTDDLSQAATHWFQQDQLILAAIMTSLASDVQPLISTATTSEIAWSTLSRAFASTSRPHVNTLKTNLTRASI